jgi:putative membrane protein
MSRAANFLRLAPLVAWIAGLLWLLTVDRPGHYRYQTFVRADLWPLLVGALLVLVLLLLQAVGRQGPGHTAARDLWPRWTQFAILLLPLAYVAGVTTGGLGSDAFVQRRTGGVVVAGFGRADNDRSDRPPTVLDLMTSDRFVGREVAVEGQVYRGEDVPAGHLVLFRFVITCCAADAVPVAVLVKLPAAGDWQNDAWVRVTGVVEIIPVRGEQGPCIMARDVAMIAEPSRPYLTPW